jgi:hypothetical protein
MNTRTISFSLVCALSILPSAAVLAEQTCKGLSEQACNASPDCGWTQGYVRKDGREVTAYCRAKPTTRSALPSPRMSAAPAN